MRLLTLKRGLLCFWALWLTVVFVTNVTDALKALAFLPESWAFASGNYLFMMKVTLRYPTPAWVVGVLFAGVIVWEALAAGLLWRAFLVFDGPGRRGRAALTLAFAVSLALWAAFMIADELLMAYDVEGTHRNLFVAQLVSLLAVRLLPDD